MKTTLTWIIVIVIIALGGWYWYSNNSGGASNTPPSTTLGTNESPNQTNTGQAAAPAVVTLVHSATLGDYLVASNGMTLYKYTKDAAGVSNCSGSCAVNWPPYLHTGAEPLVAGEGVSGALSTITRADGGAQVTYKGMPLYFWKNDTKPGDTTGQNVGGSWFVMNP